MKPRRSRERIEVRRMLRVGIHRDVCERYLGGVRLIRALELLELDRRGPGFDSLLATFYAPMIHRILAQPSAGIFAWLRKTPRPPRIYGKWR